MNDFVQIMKGLEFTQDPTLEVNDTYQPYIEGVEQDIFIKWPNRESMPDEDYEERNRTDMMGAVRKQIIVKAFILCSN